MVVVVEPLLGDEPDYEQPTSKTVKALAAGMGIWPEDLAIDHMLKNGGRGILYDAFLNSADGILESIYSMLWPRETFP